MRAPDTCTPPLPTRDISSHQEVIVSCPSPPQKKKEKAGRSRIVTLSDLLISIGWKHRCVREVCARAMPPCVATLLPVEGERRFDSRRVSRRADLDQRV